jgi:hypothetical protein
VIAIRNLRAAFTLAIGLVLISRPVVIPFNFFAAGSGIRSRMTAEPLESLMLFKQKCHFYLICFLRDFVLGVAPILTALH